jgi:hypothetical protein
VLHHPDQESAWAVVAAADVPGVVPSALLADRLAALCERLPVAGARLAGDRWQAGSPPVPVEVVDPLADPRLFDRFDLAAEPPVRVLAGPGRLAVAVHHAALDGRSAVAVLAALLGAPPPAPGTDPPAGPSAGRWPVLRRIARPADPVAASARPDGELLLTADVQLGGRDVTARLAAACVAAAGAHNRRLGRPWRRVGLSLGVGGPPGAGNLATYRRLDLGPGAPVADAARAALAGPAVPAELASGQRPPRFAAPLAARASDSVLVSNVGRHPVPEATRLVFAPVARGRSAVAFGAAGLAATAPGGPVRSTLTLRCHRLSRADAQRLLAEVLDRLA